MATRKADETTAEVAVRDVIDAQVVVPHKKGDMLSGYLANETNNNTVSPDQAYRSIIDRIMASETVDDVLGEITPMSPTDFLNRNLIVHGFVFNDSDYEEGPPVYATMAVQPDGDDETYVVNTGDQGLMAQLLRIQQLNAYPFRCQFKQGNMNRHNNYPVRMTKPVEV